MKVAIAAYCAVVTFGIVKNVAHAWFESGEETVRPVNPYGVIRRGER